MEKIEFENAPSTTTPIDADNLNLVQTNVENAIETVDGRVDNVDEVVTTMLKILGLDVDTYNPSTNYVVDEFVVYQKELWRCTEATTGAWNEEKWEKDSIIVPSE